MQTNDRIKTSLPGLVLALLSAIFIVARPAAGQFAYYSDVSGFAGLVAMMLAVWTGLAVLNRRMSAPDSLVLLAVLWFGLIARGLLHSPHLGVGVPQACDAATYMLFMLCGYFITRLEPVLAGILTRVIVATIAVQAFIAIWQRHVDYPWLFAQIANRNVELPEVLESTLGRLRLYGAEAQGTFGNPNSLAAYLVAGVWLLAGLCFGRTSPNPLNSKNKPYTFRSEIRAAVPVLILVLLLYALLVSNSKGGFVALLVGGWFFFAQRMSLGNPKRSRMLSLITGGGVLLLLGLLACGMTGLFGGVPFGRSIQVRFEYWHAAFAMIARHPLDGTGLGGFAENYPYFKTALAEEVKEAHNDYIQLWAQLGLLAPLTYFAIWLFALRMPVSLASTLPENKSDATHENQRTKDLEKVAIFGGVASFCILFAVFNSFDSTDAFELLTEKLTAHRVLAAVHTCALPFIFAVVVLNLKSPALFANEPSAADLAWVHGVRAAIGAVLVHELVDFDFTAQALMSALFLLAGMLTGMRERKLEAQTAPGQIARITRLGRLSWIALICVAVPLLYGAVWIPFTAGPPRENAQTEQDEAQKLFNHLRAQQQNPSKDIKYRLLLQEVVNEREKVVDAAPFDGDLWMELATANEWLYGASRSPQIEIRAEQCLREAARLRPLSWLPQAALGDFFLHRALRNHAAPAETAGPITDFENAYAAYSAAAIRYPLAPGIKLWKGDDALLSGNAERAASDYQSAFNTDMGITDNNVRLSSIFTDPRAGAFTRHGFDHVILRDLTFSAPGKITPAGKPGLLLRQMVALAYLIREQERIAQAEPSGENRSGGGLKQELIKAGEELCAATKNAELPVRAHAFFLWGVSFELGGNGQDAQLDQVWQNAHSLQHDSEALGTPGTPPELFRFFELRARKQKSAG